MLGDGRLLLAWRGDSFVVVVSDCTFISFKPRYHKFRLLHQLATSSPFSRHEGAGCSGAAAYSHDWVDSEGLVI